MFSNSGILSVKTLPATFKSAITSTSNSDLTVYTFSITTTLSTESDRAIGVFYAGAVDTGTINTPTTLTLNGSNVSSGVGSQLTSSGTIDGRVGFAWWLDGLVPSSAGTYDVVLTWNGTIDWSAVGLYEVYDADQTTPFTIAADGSNTSYDLVNADAEQVLLCAAINLDSLGNVILSATSTPTGWVEDLSFQDTSTDGACNFGHTTTGLSGDTLTYSSGNTYKYVVRANKA